MWRNGAEAALENLGVDMIDSEVSKGSCAEVDIFVGLGWR